MWVTRRELARLARELKLACQRADRAEDELRSERQSKDWMIHQLTSRFVTKQGGYGLDREPPAPPQPVQPHPRGWIREATEIDMARLAYYKQCAVAAGKTEDDAEMRWEAEMRGEQMTYSEGDN